MIDDGERREDKPRNTKAAIITMISATNVITNFHIAFLVPIPTLVAPIGRA